LNSSKVSVVHDYYPGSKHLTVPEALEGSVRGVMIYPPKFSILS